MTAVRDSQALPIPSPLHSGIGVPTYLTLQLIGAAFPLAAGFLLFGWRAIGSVIVIMASAVAASLVLRQVGWRGRQVRIQHITWLSALLAMTLPAHLFTLSPPTVWPLLPTAGMMLALVSWLLGGLGSPRIGPVIVTALILFGFFQPLLRPHYVLRVDHLLIGDLLNAGDPQPTFSGQDSWIERRPASSFEAMRVAYPPSQVLIDYTTGRPHQGRSPSTMQTLIRDSLPPLEDLMVAGQPGPMGTSGVMIILGGLFLLYRGVIDFRIPLLGIVGAMLALLILPVPVFIPPGVGGGASWHWCAFRPHYFGLSTAATFVNYEIFAGPLLLTLFYLANAPGQRPLTRRGKAMFGLLLGIVSAGMQLYVSTSVGPYLALLGVSLLTPLLDRLLRPRTLV